MPDFCQSLNFIFKGFDIGPFPIYSRMKFLHCNNHICRQLSLVNRSFPSHSNEVKLDCASSKLVGIVPERLLHDRFSICNCFNSPSTDGIVPLNKFPLRSRDSRGCDRTKSEGIFPLILFLLKFKFRNKGNFTTSFGIQVPLEAFLLSGLKKGGA
ncbi:hypothetical protein MtrunA17_Chr7g0250501 [Medicago truncatula]|uniref:Uncharacterized protein n=1 Tax=Medicago truncatula TaxID=3880 RepID=A0A396H7R0_MEDTR|nr:hypothetical protein MtrunA17_Chr7g0250501 [Medicago truncatula]